jgi:hypothetical protein
MEENTFNLKVKCTSFPCTLTSISQGPFPQVFQPLLYITANGNVAWNTDCNSNGTAPNSSLLSSSEFPGFIDEIRQLFNMQDVLVPKKLTE